MLDIMWGTAVPNPLFFLGAEIFTQLYFYHSVFCVRLVGLLCYLLLESQLVEVGNIQPSQQ